MANEYKKIPDMNDYPAAIVVYGAGTSVTHTFNSKAEMEAFAYGFKQGYNSSVDRLELWVQPPPVTPTLIRIIESDLDKKA